MKRLTAVIIASVVIWFIIAVAVVLSSSPTNTYGSGTLQIKITDHPHWGPVTQVYLAYSIIEVHRADAGNESGWFTIVDQSAWINLTKVINVSQTLGSNLVQAGLYNLIRFTILGAIVTVGGLNYTSMVPSGVLQIAITQGGVSVVTGRTATLLIDLNTKIEGGYTLNGCASFWGFIVPDVRATPV